MRRPRYDINDIYPLTREQEERDEARANCCPRCGGTGDDESQPIAAAGRCGRCQGTGSRPMKEHPLYEDFRDE